MLNPADCDKKQIIVEHLSVAIVVQVTPEESVASKSPTKTTAPFKLDTCMTMM